MLEILADAASDAGRVFRVRERRGQSPDHPVRLGFPESAYLKCFVLEVL
jgi:23S rRNA (cytosine1962-C5)-methyltransferase